MYTSRLADRPATQKSSELRNFQRTRFSEELNESVYTTQQQLC